MLEESVTVTDLRELASLFLLCRRCLTRAVLSAFSFFFLFLDCSPAAFLFRYLFEIFLFSGFPFLFLLTVFLVSLWNYSVDVSSFQVLCYVESLT